MRNTRVLAVAAIAALALAVVVPAASATASTPKTGTVAIQLISPSTKKALKLRGVEVVLSSKSSSYVGDKATGSLGTATFTKVPAGITFSVKVYPGDNESYVFHATTVKPVWKKTVKVAAVLPKGASLKGHLTGDGTPLAGAAVAVMTGCSASPFQTTTNSAGNFAIIGVPSGTYKLVYNVHGGDMPSSLDFGESYWKSKATFGASTSVTVKSQTSTKAATALTGLDGAVTSTHSLVGTISGAPLDGDGNAVTFDGATYSAATSTVPQCEDHGSTVGNGFTRHLSPGSYTVSVDGSDGNTYYYTGESTAPSTVKSDSATVTVSSTADTTITMAFTSANLSGLPRGRPRGSLVRNHDPVDTPVRSLFPTRSLIPTRLASRPGWHPGPVGTAT